MSAHAARLAELKELVADIAAAVGLDAKALLGGEVEALGQRLQDVRKSLTTLADVAEERAEARKEAKNELNGARDYLDSIQKVFQRPPQLYYFFLIIIFVVTEH